VGHVVKQAMIDKKEVENKGAVDSALCPLCRGQNYCEVTLEINKGADCWCRSETFTKDLLSRAPIDQQQKACICQNCVRKLNDISLDED